MISTSSYGSLNNQKQWTGLMGMVARNEVDFSFMDFTTLYSRSQVTRLSVIKEVFAIISLSFFPFFLKFKTQFKEMK
jgi:hypothetical protein